MSVRQLLMAGLGAAGSLLVNLPASGQLSNDTSTFSGEVATTCSFDGLSETASLNYQSLDNSLFGLEDFTISTNSSALRLNVSTVTANAEPSAPSGVFILADADLHQSRNGSYARLTGGSKNSSGTAAPRDYSQDSSLRITSLITTTDPVNSVFQLPLGDYSYSVTISCLL